MQRTTAPESLRRRAAAPRYDHALRYAPIPVDSLAQALAGAAAQLELDGRLMAQVRVDPALGTDVRVRVHGDASALVVTAPAIGRVRLSSAPAVGLPVQLELTLGRLAALRVAGSVTAEVALGPAAEIPIAVGGHARALVCGAADGWQVAVDDGGQALLQPERHARVTLRLRGHSVTHMMGAAAALTVDASDAAVLRATSPCFQADSADVAIDRDAKVQLCAARVLSGRVREPAELIIARPLHP